jgi:hypothetical protein
MDTQEGTSLNVKELLELRHEAAASKTRYKKSADAVLKGFDETIDSIDAMLSEQLDATGQTQGVAIIDTPDGKVHTSYFKAMARKFSVSSKEMLVNWANEHSFAHIFTATVNSETVKEYVDQFGELPPGIDTFQKVSIGFRRKAHIDA